MFTISRVNDANGGHHSRSLQALGVHRCAPLLYVDAIEIPTSNKQTLLLSLYV